MIKLYLDEDMSSQVAQALRSKGFDVVSSHEVGNDGLSDEEELRIATKEGRHLIKTLFPAFPASSEKAIMLISGTLPKVLELFA
jgi:uncharacterized protein with PIN domain